MKQVLVSQGRTTVQEVPAPVVAPGAVLVRVDHSCISAGTEMSGLEAGGEPLWKRAIRHPDKVKKAIEMALTQGVSRTKEMVEGKLSAGAPTGYSAAGVVIEAGEGVEDLVPGDRVACAGAQCAHHAEVICVPRNLAVPAPDGVEFPAASTVTLGAIALQGVRRAQPTLGESFVVIGLGMLGQLVSQMLKVNGCRVIGADIERSRIQLGLDCGMDAGLFPGEGDSIESVCRLTDGIGADGVIVTAASSSDEIASAAFRMCRKKGRVVLVGDVGLNLNRADFYEKELDFFISSSYGPGRYDRKYEEEGLDYPVGYVRWTENRNMAEYLRLLDEGRVDVGPLITETYPIDKATEAYEALKKDKDRPLTVLLSYPRGAGDESPVRVVANPTAAPSGAGAIRIAVIGAGGFAKAVHLPNLRALPDRYHVQAVASRTGHNAAAAARQFAAGYFTTDYKQVLNDPDVDAVLIATRHNLHASMALEALEAGKHVLVEKPLALTREELDRIQVFYSSAEQGKALPVLLTGFNRRFSVFARKLFDAVKNRSNPMIINYRMNAGHIPLDHWVHTEEGGGRNLGEACHVYDLFTYLTGSRVADVEARSIDPATGYYDRSDNFVAVVKFEDGSVATLTYTALGSGEYPKERMEVFAEGRVYFLDDYTRLAITGAKEKDVEARTADKGHRDELEAFARAVREGGEWPIPLWQQAQATEIAFEVGGQIRSKR